MNFTGQQAMIGLGLLTAGYFTFVHQSARGIEFESDRASESPWGDDYRPKIGDRVRVKIEGDNEERTYYVFGTTGHSLATCRLISQNCLNKTHEKQLYFFSTQGWQRGAENYARSTSRREDATPAIAYLGVPWRVQKLFLQQVVSQDILNSSYMDIQVVHIEKLPKD